MIKNSQSANSQIHSNLSNIDDKINHLPVYCNQNFLKNNFFKNIFKKQKETFVAMLLHDIKNPLIAQISALKLLSSGSFGQTNSEQQKILLMIIESCEFMKELLSTTLAVYRFDNGAVKLSFEEFNLNELVIKCIEQYSLLAQEKFLNINFNPEKVNNVVYADKNYIRRVIENLLANSINYAFEKTDIMIKVNQTKHSTVFEIENKSPEISKPMQKAIFGKYATGCGTKKHTSTGLGLYFCKKVIRAHKGTIYSICEGTKNKFVFEIPCKK